jgi:adenylate kinase
MQNRRRALVIILFGPPGSGKSTQANLLCRSLGLVRIAPGDILRAHMAAGDELGRTVAAIVRAGELVTDETINTMIAGRIAEPDCAGGFILDGYPRTVNQTVALMGVLRRIDCRPVVIQLTLDAQNAVARLSGRRECKRCGALYHIVSRPPQVPGICDADGSKLAVRIDDTEDAIRARLAVYERQTEPARKLLAEAGYAFKAAPADAAVPDVTAEQIAKWLRRDGMRQSHSLAPAAPFLSQ